VQGPHRVPERELDDLVIARPDGTPTYNFCVCVDDMDMGITHVIRGDDHVNNTPRQIHIFQALGAPVPVFAHLPTVLNEQGEKMSKRNGAKAVTQYRDEGYLPDAMVNYLARLGWSHGDDEIFSRAVPGVVQPRPPGHQRRAFDEAKLRWVNAQHLKAMPDAELAPLVAAQLQKRGVEGDGACPRCAICSRTAWTPPPWPTGCCRLRRRAAERRRPGQARHRRRQARPGQLGHAARIHAMDRPTSPPRSSRPGRARPEDAPTGHARARAGHGHAADAFGRRGAGPASARKSFGKLAKRVKSNI
jgi:hypothetical protein